MFSFGGIGATPDDHTRQAAAAALGVPLERHPEAVAEIEARFGADAYPHRVLMAEFPAGASIIPNPFNRIAAFSVRDHHFLPGFPQMAWPMLDWVLATHYPDLVREAPVERAMARVRRRREPADAADGRERRALSAREALQPAGLPARRRPARSSSACAVRPPTATRRSRISCAGVDALGFRARPAVNGMDGSGRHFDEIAIGDASAGR